MNKGFVVLLPIELMLSKSGSNLLHFATYLLHFLLRIGYLYRLLPCTSWFGQWSPDPPGLCDRRRRGAKRAQSLLFDTARPSSAGKKAASKADPDDSPR